MHTFSFVWHYGDNPADIGGDTSDDLFLNDVNDAGRIVGRKRIWAAAAGHAHF